MAPPCGDKASQSNPEEAAATHASLLMDVDFDGQVIQASVEYTVEIMVSFFSVVHVVRCSFSFGCPAEYLWT